MKPIEAWHFLPDDKRLQFGKREPVKAGRVYKATGNLELCANGMHASIDPLDALEYAPGSIICRVVLRGKIIHGEDKLCARERKVLWMADATRTLHEFAIWCATRALKRAKVTDERCWNALKVKRHWLDGKAIDAELDAAWDAARDAAWDAAWESARVASLDVARDASWDAAWECARVAAWDSAWVAAWAVERKAQSRKLTRMLNALAPKGTLPHLSGAAN